MNIETYFNKDRDMITIDDIMQLSKSEVFHLFQSLPINQNYQLVGEFRAVILPQGVLSPLISFITQRFFGRGIWMGKRFRRDNKDKLKGYNLFVQDKRVSLEKRFTVSIKNSEIDKRPTVHLDYSNYNSDFFASSMRDEIRPINQDLWIGMGMTTWGLGRFNPAHFVLKKI